MPRPSLKLERRQQVLSAYVTAVSKYGLSGATLEAIAMESGLTRPLVRHHLGNKEQMFEQLVAHVIAKFNQQTHQLVSALPAHDRFEALIGALFEQDTNATPELVFVFAELTMKSVNDKELASKLAACITEFEAVLTTETRMAFPAATPKTHRAVAHGILAIYFNSISLAPLGFSTENARSALDTLIQPLTTKECS